MEFASFKCLAVVTPYKDARPAIAVHSDDEDKVEVGARLMALTRWGAWQQFATVLQIRQHRTRPEWTVLELDAGAWPLRGTPLAALPPPDDGAGS